MGKREFAAQRYSEAVTTFTQLQGEHPSFRDTKELLARARRLAKVVRLHERGIELFQSGDYQGAKYSLEGLDMKALAEAKGIQIEIVTDFESIPMIEGQESELRQLFTNLIFNAVDAMPEGGEITIKTRSRERYVAVEISDTGVGMDEETRTKIFEPFFTTKPEGSGLGLSICRRIVAEHGGSIQVESAPGEGTTFIVILPVAEAYLQAVEGEIGEREVPPKRILVVDDERVVRQVITDMLSELGHESITAESGLEGLETFRKERFDLVLTDLGMPGMNGLQLARLMRSIDDQTPIVLLTGWGDTIDEEEAKRHGIWKVISKPVRMDELKDLIASLPRRNGSDV